MAEAKGGLAAFLRKNQHREGDQRDTKHPAAFNKDDGVVCVTRHLGDGQGGQIASGTIRDLFTRGLGTSARLWYTVSLDVPGGGDVKLPHDAVSAATAVDQKNRRLEAEQLDNEYQRELGRGGRPEMILAKLFPGLFGAGAAAGEGKKGGARRRRTKRRGRKKRRRRRTKRRKRRRRRTKRKKRHRRRRRRRTRRRR